MEDCDSHLSSTSRKGGRVTQNQINYQKYLEDVRNHRAQEVETNRSNVAREIETNRSNLVNEQLTAQRDAETKRSNLARELETNRHNQVSERQQNSIIQETARSNRANEMLKSQSNLIQADSNRIAEEKNAVEREKNFTNEIIAFNSNEIKRMDIAAQNDRQFIQLQHEKEQGDLNRQTQIVTSAIRTAGQGFSSIVNAITKLNLKSGGSSQQIYNQLQ